MAQNNIHHTHHLFVFAENSEGAEVSRVNQASFVQFKIVPDLTGAGAGLYTLSFRNTVVYSVFWDGSAVQESSQHDGWIRLVGFDGRNIDLVWNQLPAADMEVSVQMTFK